MTIRKLTPDDLPALQKISKTTFSETFSGDNTGDNLDTYLESAFNDDTLRSQLENPESAFYFILDGNEPAGYIKLNEGSAQTEFQDNVAMELERIYVLKTGHGKGFAHALMDFVLKEAASKSKQHVWLGVWENNLRAQRFYQKFGFEITGTHTFVLGESRQTDYIMRRNLLH